MLKLHLYSSLEKSQVTGIFAQKDALSFSEHSLKLRNTLSRFLNENSLSSLTSEMQFLISRHAEHFFVAEQLKCLFK